MGVIGDVVSLVTLVGIGGGIAYLVWDYKTNKCDSVFGFMMPSCAVHTAVNVAKGAVSGVKDATHEVLELFRGH
jgi:hypothetical protein